MNARTKTTEIVAVAWTAALARTVIGTVIARVGGTVTVAAQP